MILLTKDKCWIINVKIVQQELYGLSDTESILIYINLCLLSFLKKKNISKWKEIEFLPQTLIFQSLFQHNDVNLWIN